MSAKDQLPDHYDFPIQPVDFIEANGFGFAVGNVIKYVTRYERKNGVEDLKKARHYLDILIERVEGTEDKPNEWVVWFGPSTEDVKAQLREEKPVTPKPLRGARLHRLYKWNDEAEMWLSYGAEDANGLTSAEWDAFVTHLMNRTSAQWVVIDNWKSRHGVLDDRYTWLYVTRLPDQSGRLAKIGHTPSTGSGVIDDDWGFTVTDPINEAYGDDDNLDTWNPGEYGGGD